MEYPAFDAYDVSSCFFVLAKITVCQQSNAVTAETDGCTCALAGDLLNAPTCSADQICDAANKTCCTFAFLIYALYQFLHATQLSDQFCFL